jgi:hypothetical protein
MGYAKVESKERFPLSHSPDGGSGMFAENIMAGCRWPYRWLVGPIGPPRSDETQCSRALVLYLLRPTTRCLRTAQDRPVEMSA